MEAEIHPVVALLAARKKTHPEEFGLIMHPANTVPQFQGRWDNELNTLGWYMNDAEKALLFDNRSQVVFDAIRDRVMSRMLRGANYE